MINAEKKLKETKVKFPKQKVRQTKEQKLRKRIENSITVYDGYDETKGDYGKTPPTVITEPGR